MEAVVLAGGLGTRLRQVVPDLPKPMAPVAGRPFLELVIAMLGRKGFTRVVLSVGFMAEKIVGHFGTHFAGVDLSYAIEPQPLGTGGALRYALAECRDDSVFVFNGDTYLDLEVSELASSLRPGADPVIVARRVPDTSRFGVLDIADGRVLGFKERGDGGPGLINAGCYVLPVDLLDGFPDGAEFSLERDFLPNAVRTRRFQVFATRGKFIDIGVPADYERAQSELSGEQYVP